MSNARKPMAVRGWRQAGPTALSAGAALAALTALSAGAVLAALTALSAGAVLAALTALSGCGRSRSAPPVAPPAPPHVAMPSVPTVTLPVRPAIHITDRQWEQNEKAGGRIGLSFDAGGEPDGGESILKTLAERGVKATFFLTGRYAEKFPREARAIADGGHELGNHSYSHPKFTSLTNDEIATQLERAEKAIVTACGRGAKPLFRFPYGDSDRDTERAVARDGYQSVYWSLDSLDSVDPPKSADYLVERVLKKAEAGKIILMHVGYPPTAEALPRILEGLKEKGLTPVPISELMTEPAAPAPLAASTAAPVRPTTSLSAPVPPAEPAAGRN